MKNVLLKMGAAVLQRQLCHQRLWVRAQALSRPGGPWGDAQLA